MSASSTFFWKDSLFLSLSEVHEADIWHRRAKIFWMRPYKQVNKPALQAAQMFQSPIELQIVAGHTRRIMAMTTMASAHWLRTMFSSILSTSSIIRWVSFTASAICGKVAKCMWSVRETPSSSHTIDSRPKQHIGNIQLIAAKHDAD